MQQSARWQDYSLVSVIIDIIYAALLNVITIIVPKMMGTVKAVGG